MCVFARVCVRVTIKERGHKFKRDWGIWEGLESRDIGRVWMGENGMGKVMRLYQ